MPKLTPAATPPTTRKRAQTVARLVEAANAVVAEKGFQRASLEEIAARAGLTKGAVYSNFESKEHLFWAVVASRRLTIPSEWKADRSIRENLRTNAEAFCANLRDSQGNAGFLAEFILYALTNDEARARWTRWYSAPFDATPMMAEEYLKAQNMPPFRVFWTAVQTLGFGFYIQHALMPQLITDELIIAAMESLAPPEDP
jgi:AcrR family transcriptional regulator